MSMHVNAYIIQNPNNIEVSEENKINIIYTTTKFATLNSNYYLLIDSTFTTNNYSGGNVNKTISKGNNPGYSTVEWIGFYITMPLLEPVEPFQTFSITFQGVDASKWGTTVYGLNNQYYGGSEFLSLENTTTVPGRTTLQSVVEKSDNEITYIINSGSKSFEYIAIGYIVNNNPSSINITFNGISQSWLGSDEAFQAYVLRALDGQEEAYYNALTKNDEDVKNEVHSSGNSNVDSIMGEIDGKLNTTSVISAITNLYNAFSYTGTDAVLTVPAIDLPLTGGNIHIMDSITINLKQWLDYFFGVGNQRSDVSLDDLDLIAEELSNSSAEQVNITQMITPYGIETINTNARAGGSAAASAVGNKLDLSIVLNLIKIINTILLTLAVFYTAKNLMDSFQLIYLNQT